MGNEARPSFSLDDQAASAGRLPMAAWALACASFGMVAGGLIQLLAGDARRCALLAFCPSSLTAYGPAIAVALAVGGASLLLVPTKAGAAATARAAAIAAVAGGGATLALFLLGGFRNPEALLGLPMLALGAPVAVLGATDPAGRPSARLLQTPSGWLRSGSLLGSSSAIGIALGYSLAVALNRPNDIVDPYGEAGVRMAWGAAAAGLMVAGVIVWRTAPPDISMGDAQRERAEAAERRLGLTPMLRNLLIAESSLAVALAACALAVISSLWNRPVDGGPAFAAAAGALFGAGLFAAVAPTLDDTLGRGRFLATCYAAAAVGPILLAAFVASGALVLLAAAAATFALATCAAPQRFALAFDLCPSRSRLRSSLDFHAIRIASASLAAPLVWLGESQLPSLGLLIASAYGVLGLSVFLPTLGGLGRRQH